MNENGKFLHGTLEVTIFRATMSKASVPFKCISLGRRSSYVTIKIDNKKMAKTTNESDHVWNQTFQILCAHPPQTTITLTLKRKCSVLGKIDIPAHKLLGESSLINGFFPLSKQSGQQKKKLKLQFIVWFKPAEDEKTWEKALENDRYQGLKNASFPMRSNCGVTLYQDAHHHPSFHPPSDGRPRRLWEDVYNAIDGAKHLIYIAGWSFNPRMALVRDPETDVPHARGVKLGELLKRKAEEGVAVMVLLWDDETSLPLIKNKGVMKTHDEDAFSYFKHTKVVCRLCPRLHDKFPTVFAHHQKAITVDSHVDHSSRSREIMSFLGGLDLCDGRYDTEEHSLFKTLNMESHCYDFYQTSLQGASLHKGGPREPWHDVHACVVGQAARDVLENFEQRWTKQCDPSLLVPVSSIQELCQQPNPERSWNVQVFRSIDHVSASPLPKSLPIERSIHEAYVEAIRRADRFIYVENQYFIGGCHMWEENKHCGCGNLIPIEIALKVASKIKARERFSAYIVIPMWPEGVPESETVQDILHWTRETMKMMYKFIAEAIQESGEDAHPRDYLNFFCLANRETEVKGEFVPPYNPHPQTHYWSAQKHRRFMVYVHSKLMIVDDTYLLIGSANVNQRSMDGKRDTEIAIGCYQNQPKNGENSIINGGVRAFRRSLWYEHTGRDEDLYNEPHSLECVKTILSIGDKMWKIYSQDEVQDMGGVHLVTYPINVTDKGCVEDLAEIDGCFPDTKTPVGGKRSSVVSSVFTT
ncbi:phospholipase D alpha 4-like isoform X2 [Salvia hispanica]|uniref:phospholipase D alpha 4-like n=1 Tax=Salvia hispanica TaxID=49212 RepID=UPI002008FC96|nr:phospholipase D alpha 4-like [Salvia hispanica]XP_047962934.1 phospholipase D alpha 4-like isoform X1 [Salvia hispanica]XP_047962935.1 phospholipase D alpha 4-like isoform X2 [Salvia hispanica]